MSGENHRKRAHPKKEGENVLYFGFPHRKPGSLFSKDETVASFLTIGFLLVFFKDLFLFFLKICFSSLKICCSSLSFLTNLLPAAGLLYNAKAAIASEVVQETSTFMLGER